MLSHNKGKHNQQDEAALDNWLITYADMITLLLCFFAIFMSISVPSTNKMKEVTEQMRGAFGDKDNMSLDQGEEKVGGNTSRDSFLTRMNSIVALYPLQNDVQIHGTEKGMVIELNSSSFYQSGSADLTEQGKDLLAEVAGTLNGPEYLSYNINVEGHTDDNPINTPRYPSNWELSTNRATNVVRLFIDNGINPKRLKAAGYADTFPKVPNRDEAGTPIPDNQAQNRRIEIKIEQP